MIISIFGQNKSGKSTLANMISKEYDFVHISFADSLREISKILFGVDTNWKTDDPWSVTFGYMDGINWLFSIIKSNDNVKQLFINRIKKATTKGEAYRITLEVLGTDIFRNLVLDDFWCAVATFAIVKNVALGKDVVIDDARFNNEYKVLGNLNAIFIRLISPFEEPVGEHCSQKHVSGFKEDYILNNNGTKEELLNKFERLNLNV